MSPPLPGESRLSASVPTLRGMPRVGQSGSSPGTRPLTSGSAGRAGPPIDHAPRSSTTSTGCPNRAWLSTRPLRPRRPAVVNPLSQPAGSAGAPIARTSRGRGDSGEAQSVATETAMRDWTAGVSALPEPAAGAATAAAARALVIDAMISVRSPEVMVGTVGRPEPIAAEVERDAPQPGLRARMCAASHEPDVSGTYAWACRGCSVRARGPGPSHGVDHVHAPCQQSADRPRRRRAADRRRGQGARGVGHRVRVAGADRPRQ